MKNKKLSVLTTFILFFGIGMGLSLLSSKNVEAVKAEEVKVGDLPTKLLFLWVENLDVPTSQLIGAWFATYTTSGGEFVFKPLFPEVNGPDRVYIQNPQDIEAFLTIESIQKHHIDWEMVIVLDTNGVTKISKALPSGGNNIQTATKEMNLLIGIQAIESQATLLQDLCGQGRTLNEIWAIENLILNGQINIVSNYSNIELIAFLKTMEAKQSKLACTLLLPSEISISGN